jgi:hypothetical protein
MRFNKVDYRYSKINSLAFQNVSSFLDSLPEKADNIFIILAVISLLNGSRAGPLILV